MVADTGSVSSTVDSCSGSPAPPTSRVASAGLNDGVGVPPGLPPVAGVVGVGSGVRIDSVGFGVGVGILLLSAGVPGFSEVVYSVGMIKVGSGVDGKLVGVFGLAFCDCVSVGLLGICGVGVVELFVTGTVCEFVNGAALIQPPPPPRTLQFT